MNQTAGRQANAAIFAADGSARHRMVRAGVAAGAALLAAWVIALALGVLGGFDSLPGLPSPESTARSEAPPAQGPHPAPPPPRTSRSGAAPQRVPARTTSSPGGGASGGARRAPARTTPTPKTTTQPPTGSGVTTSTSPGRGHASAPTTTGKPVGSPGNGPGGTGAPGQLR